MAEDHFGGFAQLDGADPATARVDITIDVTSVFSDNKLLTDTIKGKGWFDIENHPTARFVSTGVAKTETGYTVTGDLTINGITKSLTFPASTQLDDKGLVVEVEFPIPRADYDITAQGVFGSWGDYLVKPDVMVNLYVEAQPAT